MRILIADDDVTSRAVLAGVLRKEGHQVASTVNGLEAWETMQRFDAPALVILDWMMPEMDGQEVLRRIRGVQTERPPYVIMLTSRGEKNDIVTGLDAGANDYLSKPFDVGELRARVEVGRRMIEMQEELFRSREMLAHQATHDPLTGLPNRRAALDRLREELVRVGRENSLLAIGMCDIDHFKQVNDSYGHQVGDDVLCGVARILSNGVRMYDTVGRLGGEEFLVVAPMKFGIDWLAMFARLRSNVAETKVTTRSGQYPITVSIGVACTSTDCGLDELLEAADAALYQAKNDGRNRVACSKDSDVGGVKSCVS